MKIVERLNALVTRVVSPIIELRVEYTRTVKNVDILMNKVLPSLVRTVESQGASIASLSEAMYQVSASQAQVIKVVKESNSLPAKKQVQQKPN